MLKARTGRNRAESRSRRSAAGLCLRATASASRRY
jgi:hypothetical protein